jgi:hypothetical protein
MRLSMPLPERVMVLRALGFGVLRPPNQSFRSSNGLTMQGHALIRWETPIRSAAPGFGRTYRTICPVTQLTSTTGWLVSGMFVGEEFPARQCLLVRRGSQASVRWNNQMETVKQSSALIVIVLRDTAGIKHTRASWRRHLRFRFPVPDAASARLYCPLLLLSFVHNARRLLCGHPRRERRARLARPPPPACGPRQH